MDAHQDPIRLTIGPSPCLGWLLLLLYLIAIMAIWVTPWSHVLGALHIWLPLMLSLLLLARLWRGWRREALRDHPDSLVELFWGRDGEWWLRQQNQAEALAMVPVGEWMWVPRMILIAFRPQQAKGIQRWKRVYLVLCSDAVNPEALRRFRVRLRTSNGVLLNEN